MKRVLSIVLAICMMVGCACAESTDSMTTGEMLLEILRLYCDQYDKNPYSFTPAMISCAYEAFELVVHYDAFESANAQLTLESYGDEAGGFGSLTKSLAKSVFEIACDPNETYYMWLSGNMTDKECLDGIMQKASIYLKVKDKQKSEGGK